MRIAELQKILPLSSDLIKIIITYNDYTKKWQRTKHKYLMSSIRQVRRTRNAKRMINTINSNDTSIIFGNHLHEIILTLRKINPQSCSNLTLGWFVSFHEILGIFDF